MSKSAKIVKKILHKFIIKKNLNTFFFHKLDEINELSVLFLINFFTITIVKIQILISSLLFSVFIDIS